MTFAQIQEQQRLAIEAEQETIRQAANARRSFLDIQEEERKEEERRREEQKQAEEFEKWFAEEAKRVQKQQSKNAGKQGAAGGAANAGKGGKGQEEGREAIAAAAAKSARLGFGFQISGNAGLSAVWRFIAGQ